MTNVYTAISPFVKAPQKPTSLGPKAVHSYKNWPHTFWFVGENGTSKTMKIYGTEMIPVFGNSHKIHLVNDFLFVIDPSQTKCPALNIDLIFDNGGRNRCSGPATAV